MSILFADSVLECFKQIKIHEVTRLNGKGIPLSVQQYEVNDKMNLD